MDDGLDERQIADPDGRVEVAKIEERKEKKDEQPGEQRKTKFCGETKDSKAGIVGIFGEDCSTSILRRITQQPVVAPAYAG